MGECVIGRPDSVKPVRDRPESAKPNRDRPPSVIGPARAYTPLQFENSLGKLQVCGDLRTFFKARY